MRRCALEMSLGCSSVASSCSFSKRRNFLVLFIWQQINITINYHCSPFAIINPTTTHSQFYQQYILMEVRILEAENQIYQKEKLLGEGAFGKAYLVRKKTTGELLVIKEVSIDHMSQKEQEQTIKEAQILRNFKHPLIVRFIEVYATKQNKLKIVMEYAQCGDLSKAIANKRAQKRQFEQTQILDWFTQICLAMKHVHDRKILHRDIKGQNIFITKANTLKLGDFGIARVLNKTQDKARTVVGTPYYLSPQIIQNKPYSFKSDIWSMGVLLYELCALAPPFNATSLQFLALKIVKGSYPPITANYSKQLKGLVNDILQIDPNKRPSLKDILQRPFIKERIQKFLSQTNHKIEFSHTILHNQKVEISNKLVKVQDQKKLQVERSKLKDQAAVLKEKMERKKQEDRMKEEERLRRRREDEVRKEDENQKRKEQQIKMREVEQRRAVQQRKQWVQRQKKKQEDNIRNLQEQQRRRVLQIAELAKQRQREQRQLVARKERLMKQKWQMEKREGEEVKKKQNKQKEQIKRMDDFNQFARKQWFQNQMIRKRAEERAKQSELQSYSTQPPPQEEYHQNRPQSTKNKNVRESQQKKITTNNAPSQKRNSVVAYQPSEQQQLQNALLNPNFNNKKSPQIKSKLEQKNTPTPPSKLKEQVNDKSKKNYDQAREQIKKDREEFLKGKHKQQEVQAPIETLKPGKWDKRPNKSREKQQESDKNSRVKQTKATEEQQMMESEDLKLNINDEQQLKDYLAELEGLLNNVNKKIEKLQPLPEIPVQEEIILRDDDNQELDYSITASFDNALVPPNDNADFDLFSDYSKLEELRMNLEDKFGTSQFIKIYRVLENELQNKGLQNFNIFELEQQLGKQINKKLILDNLPMLLTLIVMEEKIGA